MKIVLVNTYDKDGGAALATYRLHQGLKLLNIDSHLVVQYKSQNEPSIHGYTGLLGKLISGVASRLDSLPLLQYPARNSEFWSVQWFDNNTINRIKNLKPDIVHLHWIGRGFLPIKHLSKINCPIVWTFHDMWGFTGGCHYDQNCGRWKSKCGLCPQLKSNFQNDLSKKTWDLKEIYWKNLSINITTPSQWLANCVRESPLLNKNTVNVIPNGINTTIYKPTNKDIARKIFNFPINKNVIIFGAMNSTTNERKGWQYLKPTLKLLAKRGWGEEIILGVFGGKQPHPLPNFDFETKYLGTLNDDHQLSLLYSSADIFLAPSLQDNLPNTVVESLSCGTPCVAFNIGGMPDMIKHKVNGYLAEFFNIQDFATGIEWILESKEKQLKLSQNARETVLKNFTLDSTAKKFVDLYNRILINKSKFL